MIRKSSGCSDEKKVTEICGKIEKLGRAGREVVAALAEAGRRGVSAAWKAIAETHNPEETAELETVIT